MTSYGGSGIGETVTGDKLVLRGLKFHGYHGVKPEERKLGQKFLIDVDAWMDLREAGNSDRLTDTISYTAVYSIVKDVVEGTPRNLLESVAQQIAAAVLSKYTDVAVLGHMLESRLESRMWLCLARSTTWCGVIP
ncbi:hypothetical protein CASFOL_000084 [Castilleja foliolosa]|uniref:7,8-dihydroneopterin aldolase n=2 Tax=Castilleja foliolosa TaxID=1961234 RepID=A0ABD3EMM1_9LAMI